MKTIKLMVTALCVTACIATTAFAEDDFGIEAASPEMASDPVNPQPGMKADAYNFKYISPKQYRQMTSSLDALRKMSAVRTYVDKSENFSRAGVQGNIGLHTIKWEGFIKCKRSATYTFSFGNRDSYSFYVNGRKHIDSCFRQTSRDIDLKAGWNHVVIIAHMGLHGRNNLVVTYRPKGSLSDPRPIAPKDLFHDQKPEEDW